MSKSEIRQVTRTAAEIYEEFFVPALFQQWASRVAGAAMISSGQRILDVACGTGVLTREVAHRAGENGSAIGLDLNEGMLVVARRKAPEIEWRQGRAEGLPFDSDSFDAVVCSVWVDVLRESASCDQRDAEGVATGRVHGCSCLGLTGKYTRLRSHH
ncbi:methyltransferase domain-containing protein [Pleurocapsales cyanobacterium LEGE 06147]|nr:methyltransferase domain-containing protein [Pleurocapsales cyanobacterium LEGE 06147]